MPRVMRSIGSIAAMAWASVKSSGSSFLPNRFQWRSRTKRSSSRPYRSRSSSSAVGVRRSASSMMSSSTTVFFGDDETCVHHPFSS
jgi:hypothetical protein